MKKMKSLIIAIMFLVSLLAMSSVTAKTGGPDAYGFTYKDSESDVPFEWIEISWTGTDTGLTGDDVSMDVNIGFNFMFYGNIYSTISISSNGYLTFGTDKTDCSNTPIPGNGNDPDDAIYPFWDDLDLNTGTTGNVYYRRTYDMFIVEWYDIPHISDDPGDCPGGERSHFTFQVILYKNSNVIKFQYLRMENGCAAYADGSSATVGIENSDGTDGLQYSYNTSSIYDRLAIGFVPPGVTPPWEETFRLPMEKIWEIIKRNQEKKEE